MSIEADQEMTVAQSEQTFPIEPAAAAAQL